MTYYKLVDVKSTGTTISLNARGTALVEYKIGEFVEAPKLFAKARLHLLVFKSKSAALRSFRAGAAHRAKLFKVHVRGVTKLPKRRLDPVGIGYYPLTMKAAVIRRFLEENSYMNWPTGSAMVKKVKLVEEVKQ